MQKINYTEIKLIPCKVCSNYFEIKIYANPNHVSYRQPIVAHIKRKTCSTECQNIWQRSISWEQRIGAERAEEIRDIRKKQLTENNPSKNPAVAERISESMKAYIIANPNSRKKEKNGFFGKTHSVEQKELWSNEKTGKWSYNILQKIKQTTNTPKKENHPMWQGGISNGEYGVEFTKELKRLIKESYNYHCTFCKNETTELDIHHIDYDKKNNSIENLIPLCKSCHGKTNYNREEWKKYFQKK